MRQHPREFGRAATYVETIDAPEIDEYSERFIEAINYHGLVEIEYKRDDRDGEYKLLDVNARAWGFHALGGAAGVDFPWLLYADALGLPIEPLHAKSGVGWLRLLTDIPTALRDIFSGHLSVGEYLRSLRATGIESVFAWADPLPAFFDAALVPYILFKKYPALLRPKA
jgi:D-aspartate ligase